MAQCGEVLYQYSSFVSSLEQGIRLVCIDIYTLIMYVWSDPTRPPEERVS